MKLIQIWKEILGVELHGKQLAYYYELKYQKYRIFSGFLILIGSVGSGLFWFRDYMIASDLATETLLFRLIMMITIALPSVYLFFNYTSRFFHFIYTISMTMSYFLLLLIMKELNQFAAFNSGAFLLFFMFVPILIMQMNNFQSVTHILVVTLSPNCFYFIDRFPEIDFLFYNVYSLSIILPLLVMTVLLNQVMLKFQVVQSRLTVEKHEAEALARKDGLTGVFNKRAFHEYGEKLFLQSNRYQRPLSLIILDIDYFKKINDRYGHLAGDEALKTIVKMFSIVARQSDVVCRIGGEEFASILPETGINEAELIAERFRKEIEAHHFQLEEYSDIRMTISLGVAEKKKEDSSFHELFLNADKALYEAKEGGRNKTVSS